MYLGSVPPCWLLTWYMLRTQGYRIHGGRGWVPHTRVLKVIKCTSGIQRLTQFTCGPILWVRAMFLCKLTIVQHICTRICTHYTSKWGLVQMVRQAFHMVVDRMADDSNGDGDMCLLAPSHPGALAFVLKLESLFINGIALWRKFNLHFTQLEWRRSQSSGA